MRGSVEHTTHDPGRHLAGADPMTWFKVDDSFYDHPKVFDAPDCAVALWTRAGTWSARNLTDGFVPSGMPARLCDDHTKAVRELVRRGLWSRTRGGFQFHTTLPNPRGGQPLTVCAWLVSERAYIPPTVRQLVLERDEFRCVECGSTVDLTLDHIHPHSKGGPGTEANLRVLCRSCNSRKGARIS